MKTRRLVELLRQLQRDLKDQRVLNIQISGSIQGDGEEAVFNGRFMVDYRQKLIVSSAEE